MSDPKMTVVRTDGSKARHHSSDENTFGLSWDSTMKSADDQTREKESNMLHSDDHDFEFAKRIGYDLNPDTGLISDGEARAIAASYQSSGSIGSVFASIASGVPRAREEILNDSGATASELAKVKQECDDLVLIERWAEYAESDLLLEICLNCDAPATQPGARPARRDRMMVTGMSNRVTKRQGQRAATAISRWMGCIVNDDQIPVPIGMDEFLQGRGILLMTDWHEAGPVVIAEGGITPDDWTALAAGDMDLIRELRDFGVWAEPQDNCVLALYPL